MRLMTSSTLLLSIAIPAVVFATGDERHKTGANKMAMHNPDYCKLGDIVGAKVSMTPDVEAVKEAAKDGDKADRPKGKIDDVLFKTCDGGSAWAVVTFDKTLGFGGKTVAVPCDQLNWNIDEKTFDLHQTEDQLKALPSFDVKDAKKKGLDHCCDDLATYWPGSHAVAKVKDQSHEAIEAAKAKFAMDCPAVTIDDKAYPCSKSALILASDLDDVPVLARGEKFGKIDTIIVDRANHRLAYFIVDHGGALGVGETEVILPVRGICLHENGTDHAYSVNRSTTELASAAKYTKPDNGVLTADQAKRADELFAAEIKRRSDILNQ